MQRVLSSWVVVQDQMKDKRVVLVAASCASVVKCDIRPLYWPRDGRERFTEDGVSGEGPSTGLVVVVADEPGPKPCRQSLIATWRTILDKIRLDQAHQWMLFTC